MTWILTAVAVVAFVAGFVAAVRLDLNRLPEPRHEHVWGPWEEAHKVEARTSFEASVALVQIRHCLDEECNESDIKNLKLVSSL